jgi:hypothetical protein
MGQPSRDQNSILNDLFPSTAQLTHLFVSRRQPQNTLAAAASQDDLTPAETEFITKCERRRENLRSLGDGEKQVQELKEKYSWETFLRELRAYVAKNWEIIVGSRGGKPRRSTKKRVSAPAVPEYEDTGMGFIAPVQQQGVPTEIAVNSQGQPIWEAYEKARLIPPSPIVGSVATSAPVATGIPPPQTPVGKVTSQGNTPRNTSEGNQVRRPWTKDEGTPNFQTILNCFRKCVVCRS